MHLAHNRHSIKNFAKGMKNTRMSEEEMAKDTFEPGLKRMIKIWTGRNERASVLKMRATVAQRQKNEGTVSRMTRSLVQKGNAINGGTRKVSI